MLDVQNLLSVFLLIMRLSHKMAFHSYAMHANVESHNPRDRELHILGASGSTRVLLLVLLIEKGGITTSA